MARRIPTGIDDVAELGRIVDAELQRLDRRTKTAFVNSTRLANPTESYFFTDDGELMYFNIKTQTEHSVSIV